MPACRIRSRAIRRPGRPRWRRTGAAIPVASAAFVVAVLAAAPALAEPLRAQRPGGQAPGPLFEVPGLENLDIQTDSTTFEGSDVLVMSGYVDVHDRERGVRLQADEVRFTISTKEFVAEGNVVFDQDELRLTGSRMVGDLDDGTGEVEDALGMAPGEVYFRAEKVVQLEPGKFRIERGVLTPCRQAVPIWEFQSRSMTLEVNDHASMLLPMFKVKGMPVAVLPYVYWPLEEDGRSTGFLIPRIGTSTNKGFMFSESFFWAIGKSYDVTLTYDRFSKAGNGYGAEFRHAFQEGAEGRIRFYRLDGTVLTAEQIAAGAVSVPGGTTLDARHVQELPYQFRLTGNANFFTSTDFIRGFEDSFNRFLRRESSVGVFLTRNWDAYSLNLIGDHRRTFFGQSSSVALRRLPEAEFRIRSKGLGPLYLDLESSAARLERLEQFGTEGLDGRGGSYFRLDGFPQMSMPVTEIPWLTFRPFANWRSTYWSQQQGRRSFAFEPEPLMRHFYETGIESVGPSFFRIFDTPASEYSPRLKHVIEPRIFWRRRSELDFDGRIINFDEIDFFGGDSHDLFVTLTTRLFAKRFPDRNAESRSVWEVFSVDLTRQFDLSEKPEGRLLPTIPIPYRITTRFTPNQQVTVRGDIGLTPDYGLAGVSLSGFMNFENASANATWIRSARPFPDPDDRSKVAVATTSRVTGGGRVDLLGRAVTVGGHASLDISNRALEEFMVSGQWNTQCCSIGGQFRRIDFSFRQESQFSIIVELANVGSIGFGSDES